MTPDPADMSVPPSSTPVTRVELEKALERYATKEDLRRELSKYATQANMDASFRAVQQQFVEMRAHVDAWGNRLSQELAQHATTMVETARFGTPHRTEARRAARV